MFEKQKELLKIIHTTKELLKADGMFDLINLLDNSDITIEDTYYDNWNGGTTYFTIYLNLLLEKFIRIRNEIEKIEADLLEKFQTATRHIENEGVSAVRIAPKSQPKINWNKLYSAYQSKEDLIKDIEYLKNTMIAVSTGGPRIQDINNKFTQIKETVDLALNSLGLINPNPYNDLWDWYGKWSSSFPTYRERRIYINNIYSDLIDTFKNNEKNTLQVSVELTGWERIERSIAEISTRQSSAINEEQFQVIGLLCRETIITLSQLVFNENKHKPLDNISISKTDAKRMLESYIYHELSGTSKTNIRKYARATLNLANELTHRRNASKKDSLLCSYATIALINFIGTIEGRI